jgi:hypothetical protein
MSTTSTIVLLGAAALVWVLAFGRRLPRKLRRRSCQEGGWRRAFPAASKPKIRKFLSIFVSAFAFDDKEKLKLHPDDPILSIYRAHNPHRWQADALELETLADELRRAYGVQLSAVWSERLTLGELFAHTRAPRPPGNA